jgi:urease accessory protein
VTTPVATAVSRLHGRLELVFSLSGGKTVLSRTHVTAPLKVVRPFPLAGGAALVQVLTLGPGLCAGDAHAIDISVEPGATAVVIMQSAARILSMPEGSEARQQVTLRVAAGGQLEYYPGLTIPYTDSTFVQVVTADLQSGCRFGIADSWSTGRSSRGEYLRFRRVSSRTMVNVDGRIAYADAVELEPGVDDVKGTGILEAHRYLASGFWYGATLPPDSTIAPRAGVIMAMGQSAPGQAYLRALAMDGFTLAECVGAAVQRVRCGWDQPFIPFQRFTA